MKKIKINNLFMFLIGLMGVSCGVILVVKSDLGITVATSVPYVFSLYFTKITFGQWNYIVHGITLILLVFIVRKLTVKYLMSFLVAFLFGLSIDFFNFILAPILLDSLIEKVFFFIIGSAAISIGVAGLMKSDYPIMPFDTFIKEVTFIKNIKYSKFKTGFDLVCFTISLIASLLFFGKIYGLHVGTLISAVILGSTIGMCLDFMNEHIEGKSIFPKEKTELLLDFDFLNFKKPIENENIENSD